MDLRVSRKTVQQGAVEKLRQAILSGVFMPGNRLIEADLCNSLGVSRPLLREALRSLQAERLIDIVPNRGSQIPLLSWHEAKEIYEVRELLEGEAAARCCAVIADEDLDELARSLEAFGRASRGRDAAAERISTTTDFFAIILRNCGNKIIEETLTGLQARVNFLRARSMSLPGRAKQSYAEMNAIFVAIKARNAKQARKTAQEHVVKARNAAQQAFESGRE
jgi:DNA-binding GntR family transcriptional regulator